MARVTRFKGLGAQSDGYFCGAKNTETPMVESIAVTFLNASTAQTIYAIVPAAGNVTGVSIVSDTATVGTATYTVKHGSAGVNIATALATTGVAGYVSAIALSTGGTAVTAGEGISITRSACVTTNISTCIVNVQQLA